MIASISKYIQTWYRDIVSYAKENPVMATLVFGTIILGAFLRVYKIPEYATFLGDQARDALVILRIVRFEDFTLIGPPSSVGNVFLGPFFYYLMSPFLGLFLYNPIGLSYGVAFLSIGGMIASFFIVRRYFGQWTALFFLIFLAFSDSNVRFARYAWNPNLLPIFSFFTLYFFHQALNSKQHKNKLIFAFVFGSFYALSIQLHHLGLVLIAPCALFWVYNWWKDRSNKELLQILGVSFIGFIVFYSPLILFDLKNNFINSKSFFSLFTAVEAAESEFYGIRLLNTVHGLFKGVLVVSMNRVLSVLFLIGTFGVTLFFFNQKVTISKEQKRFLTLHMILIVIFIFAFAFIDTERHRHYYNTVYYSMFLVWAYILYSTYKFITVEKLWLQVSIALVLIGYVSLNGNIFNVIYKEGSAMMARAERVADFAGEKIGDQPFNIAGSPFTFSPDPYAYFLEVDGKKAADTLKGELTEQLFVFCNKDPCTILNEGHWDIASFGIARIEEEWEIEDVRLFKVVPREDVQRE